MNMVNFGMFQFYLSELVQFIVYIHITFNVMLAKTLIRKHPA